MGGKIIHSAVLREEQHRTTRGEFGRNQYLMAQTGEEETFNIVMMVFPIYEKKIKKYSYA